MTTRYDSTSTSSPRSGPGRAASDCRAHDLRDDEQDATAAKNRHSCTVRRMATSRPAPLAGLRVIEVSMLGPGALTTHLADLGADVIKVETPQGDYRRHITWARA